LRRMLRILLEAKTTHGFAGASTTSRKAVVST
jgi:hypothetical protein